MRHHREALVPRRHRDAPRFRQAADAADIRLHHVQRVAVHQFAELEAGIQPLAGRDPHRRCLHQLGIAFDIVGRQRRLDEIDVLVREHIDGAQGFLPVAPGIGDIDHDRHLRPDRFAAGTHDLGNLAIILDLQ